MKPAKKQSVVAQPERFMKTAREIEADESEEAFRSRLAKVAKAPPQHNTTAKPVKNTKTKAKNG